MNPSGARKDASLTCSCPKHLFSRAATYGWLTLNDARMGMVSRANFITGEAIPVERWVNQIDCEDWDWFQSHWDWMDEFDYRLKQAGVKQWEPL